MKRSRALPALQAVVFIDLLGLTLMLPALPFHVVALGGTGLWLGMVLAGFSAAQVLAAPVLGRLADRFGRRRMLLLGLVGSTVSLALLAVAPVLPLVLAARVLAGLCGGSIGVAHALAADVTPPEQRAHAMGRLGMAIGAAFTIGPLLGAGAATAGFTAVALLGAAVAAAAIPVAWLLLPRSVPPAGEAPPTTRSRPPLGLLGAGFVGMVALVGMESTVALLAEHRFGAGPGFVGILLCVAGLSMTLVQAYPVGAAARRWGHRRVAAGGALLMAVSLATLPVVGVAAFVAAVAGTAVGQGMLATTTTSLLSIVAPAGQRGAFLGYGQAAAAMGRLVGPAVAGGLYDIATGLPAAVGSVLAGLVCVVVAVAARPGATMSSDRSAIPKDGT